MPKQNKTMKEKIEFRKGKPIKPLIGHKITGVQRMGGYYRWDWKFPFRHFVKEELLVFYKDTILIMS